MNVDELQLHLSNLGHLLTHAGGKKVAEELGEFVQRLQPYRDRKMKDFFDLLDKAEKVVRTGVPVDELYERLHPYRDRKWKDFFDLVDKADEIVRTGVPPAKPKRVSKAKAKADPQVTESVCQRIVELYQRAKEPETTSEQIEAAFADLERIELTVPKLQELARKIDISQSSRKKADLIGNMRRVVLERKGAMQRVEV